MRNRTYFFFLAGWLMALAVLISCSDTIDPPEPPQNLILEYKVTNIPNEEFIYGSVDNDANTITVYLPFFMSLDVIDPEITVNEGATLEGDILPVSVAEENQTYTVTDSDGESRIYSLSIVNQTAPSLTADYIASTPRSNPNNTEPVEADLFSYSAETLTAKFTNQETGEVFEPDLSNVEINLRNSGLGYSFSLLVPAEATEGNYDVEIGFLGNIAQIERSLLVEYRSPRFAPGSINVTRGQNWTVEAGDGYVLLGLTKLEVEIEGQRYNLPIVSSDRLTATVTIPDNLPPGEHRPGTLYGVYTDWDDEVIHRTSSFTVE